MCHEAFIRIIEKKSNYINKQMYHKYMFFNVGKMCVKFSNNNVFRLIQDVQLCFHF